MGVWSRLSSWICQKCGRATQGSLDARREFVYLDEVAVYSILSSHKSGIVTQFTESQTASLNSEVKGTIGVGFGETKANIGSRVQSSQVEATQVLRKAIIQTSFKELYETEREMNAIRFDCHDEPPRVSSIRDLENLLASSRGADWIVDPCTLNRGEILEVEVKLEADPIFRLATIISTLFELVEGNERLFEETATANIREMRSMARLLESLLSGLVPIRGRLVDYQWTSIAGRDVLVHRSLLCQIPADRRPKMNPTFLVGVAQSDLFWKDIRRVLFSQARYTTYCRLATSGLANRWTPVKMADVFSGIAPDFNELMQELGDQLISGFKHSVHSANNDGQPTIPEQNTHHGERILREYVGLAAEYHSLNLDPDDVDALIRGVLGTEHWSDNVADNRPFFHKVEKRMHSMFQVKTPVEVAPNMRLEAVRQSNSAGMVHLDGPTITSTPPESKCDRYLDSEIIAIYW